MSRLFKEMVVIFLGLASFVYLVFPTFGWFEILPDALPFIGSIDEGTASLILISVLRYYGLDLSRLFGKRVDDKQHPLIPQSRQTDTQPYVQGTQQQAGRNRR